MYIRDYAAVGIAADEFARRGVEDRRGGGDDDAGAPEGYLTGARFRAN